MATLEPWHWRSLPLNCRTGSEVFECLFQTQDADGHTDARSKARTDNPQGASGLDPSPQGQILEAGDRLSPLNWRAIATLLESPVPAAGQPSDSALARFSICAGAPRCPQGRPAVWTPAVGEILPMLRSRLTSAAVLRQNLKDRAEGAEHDIDAAIPMHLPFVGGWLGWLGYDLAWEIETLPRYNSDPLPFPVAFWYEPEAFAVLDHQAQQLWLAATEAAQLDDMERSLVTLEFSTSNPAGNSHLPGPDLAEDVSTASDFLSRGSDQTDKTLVTFVSDQAAYEAAVRQAKRYIHAGDIFQTNLSLRFSVATQAQSWDIYRVLQQLNPSPFASYWRTPWGDVVSCSPERLVQRQGNRVQTRPIAGTRPRGQTPQIDRQLRDELLENAKENAEHIMLVDLERNDLGRVCEWGSVQVDELLTIEPYSHVMHLVSNVKGKMRSPYDSIDLIRAMFPGGTITGCPKVRCMEIIEELEPLRRSLFYGSCGYLDWRGDLDLNILIRTLLYVPDSGAITEDERQLAYQPLEKQLPAQQSLNAAIAIGQIGAGIVADSHPHREWQESLAKAQAQIEALRRVRVSPDSRMD